MGIGAGTTTMNESAVGPAPQLQVYVPGVSPKLVKVAPFHVADEVIGFCETYPGGTKRIPAMPMIPTSPPEAASGSVSAGAVPKEVGPTTDPPGVWIIGLFASGVPPK